MLGSKVKKLLCARSKLLVIKHPECIEYLECRNELNSDLEFEQLVQFKSLKVLHFPVTKVLVDAFEFLENLEELLSLGSQILISMVSKSLKVVIV